MKIKYVWSLNINFERQVGSRFLKKVYYMYYVSADGKILFSDVKKCPIIMTKVMTFITVIPTHIKNIFFHAMSWLK